MELIKPRNVMVEKTSPGRTVKITFEPLERGYGTTLGNSLRRILLSSLEGAAVSAVNIDGVLHEFDTIKGVREDVLDIILSLKELDLRMGGDVTTRILSLDIQGPAIVTAGDLVGSNIQILNPDLVIAHINEDGHLKLEATVSKGRGYVPAHAQETEDKVIGTLFVDASYSPVRSVSTRVENARVGQRTNYDKLIMEVTTNGALSAEEAVNMAADILQGQLAVFADFTALEEVESESPDEPDLAKLMAKPIDHLDLSVRSMNCLKNDHVFYVGDLVQRSEQKMLRTPNFGKKSLSEIKEVLANMNLSLGMKIPPDWMPDNLARELEAEESVSEVDHAAS